MSEVKHTQGPWTKSMVILSRSVAVTADAMDWHGQNCIAYIAGDDVTAVANARLIAKAPELFAALKDMVDRKCRNCAYKKEPWSEAEECQSFCQELKYKRLIDEVKGGAE